jgi:hypothetical protein
MARPFHRKGERDAMNNQAAQTMPELPARVDLYSTTTGRGWGYTADQMHQYARDYAAALSQPAGVAEGMALVPIVTNPDDTSGENGGDWYCETHPWAAFGHDDCGGTGIPSCARIPMLCNLLRFASQRLREQEAIHAPIAEALLKNAASAKYCCDERPCTPYFSDNGPFEDTQAASGGEDDSLTAAYMLGRYDGRKATTADLAQAQQNPKPPSGASVSERGREAVVWAAYGTSDEFGPVMLPDYVGTMDVIRKRVMEDARREGFNGHFVERMANLGWWVEPLFHAPAIERALSSPRQEGEGYSDIERMLTEADASWQLKCRPNLKGTERLLFLIYDIALERKWLEKEVMEFRSKASPSTAASTQGDDNG